MSKGKKANNPQNRGILAGLDNKINEVIKVTKATQSDLSSLSELIPKAPPPSQQPPESSRKSIQEFLSGLRLRSGLVWKLWKVIETLSVIIGLWWAVRNFRQNISVDLSSTINKTKPYAVRFLLSNNGPFRITHVTYSCEGADLQMQNKVTIRTVVKPKTNIPVLDPGDKRSLYCDFTTLPFKLLLPEDSNGFKAQVKISYDLPLWAGNVRFARFAFILDSSGELIWIPVGPTEGEATFSYQDGTTPGLTPK